jgi:hypothetical protein
MDTQVMATKATETTMRLNLRIRFSYKCAQLSCWSFTDARLTVSTNPVAFTYPLFYAGREGIAARKLSLRGKQICRGS